MPNGIDPFQYLQRVSEYFDSIDSRDQINTVLDELEFIFKLLEPQIQPLAEDLIAKLTAKLKQLDD